MGVAIEQAEKNIHACVHGTMGTVRFVGWADWVDCRCFLSFVFLGVARRLELSPCNTMGTSAWPNTERLEL